VLPVQSVPRSYKWDSWNNELVMGQPPAGKIVSTVAKDMVGIHHQATIREDTADSENLLRAVMNCRVYELAIAI
jgi:hypothetical protein